LIPHIHRIFNERSAKHIKRERGTKQDYFSYLLRIWWDCNREGELPGKKMLWQASLQSPQTGKLEVFARLEELFSFLKQQTGLETLPEDKRDNS